MEILKLLIVEGNTNEENINFDAAGCIPQSENFKLHLRKLEPNCEIDIVSPGDDHSISKIISSSSISFISLILPVPSIVLPTTTSSGKIIEHG